MIFPSIISENTESHDMIEIIYHIEEIRVQGSEFWNLISDSVVMAVTCLAVI